MILQNAKTTWVGDQPWRSDDGKVTIWKIEIEADGKRYKQSTMSAAVATQGFAGDVEIYTNAKGKEYVRQAPKEDASHSGGTDAKSGVATGTPRQGASDPRTMYVSYVKDIIVALINNGLVPTDEKLSVQFNDVLVKLLAAASIGGDRLQNPDSTASDLLDNAPPFDGPIPTFEGD